MSRIFFLLLIPFLVLSTKALAQCNDQLVNDCALNGGDNVTYIKDFKAKLAKGKRGSPAPTAQFSMLLNKGSHYRFGICSAVEYEGKGVLQLYDAERMYGSTYDFTTGKESPYFDFLCKKTAVYQIFIYFQDGLEGCAAGIVFMVR